MAKNKKKTPKLDVSNPALPLKSSPFAGLGELAGALPEGKPVPDAEPAAPPTGPTPTAPRRAVVRLERKGRRGKEVTLVEQLDLPPEELESWLKALKQSLGCGGSREGETLVLQGDQRETLPPLLKKRGVKKVSVG